jgi:AcrR family transcriptional regulator
VRTQLLDAAAELFATLGYSEVSHADIAMAAGMGRTTFYEYFGSKEDVLVQLVAERLPRLAGDLLAGIPDDVDTPSRLSELTVRMIEFVATDPLGHLLHSEVPRLENEAQLEIAATHINLTAAFVDLYQRGVAEGLFREVPVDIAARLMHEVIMAAGRVLKSAEDPKQRVHEVAESVAEFLVAGLSR